MADDEDEFIECKDDECEHEAHPKKDGFCACCARAEREIKEGWITRSQMQHFRGGERHAQRKISEMLGLRWDEKDEFTKLVCEGRYDW
jgi:hypothetical protein